MFKLELDYQVDKAVEYIDKGGDFEKWLESKEFTQKESDYIKKHPKIMEKLSKKL